MLIGMVKEFSKIVSLIILLFTFVDISSHILTSSIRVASACVHTFGLLYGWSFHFQHCTHKLSLMS